MNNLSFQIIIIIKNFQDMLLLLIILKQTIITIINIVINWSALKPTLSLKIYVLFFTVSNNI